MPLGRESRTLGEIGRDIRWGVTHVTPFVLAFGGISLLGELLGVKFHGLNIQRTIFIYAVFGLLTGTVVGALRPIASTTWGAAVIGAIVGIPLAFYVRVLAVGLGDWNLSDIIILPLFISICAFCAVGFRRGYGRAEQRDRTDRTSK